MDLELLSDPSGDGVPAAVSGGDFLVYRLVVAPRPGRALLWGRAHQDRHDGRAVVPPPKELPGDH